MRQQMCEAMSRMLEFTESERLSLGLKAQSGMGNVMGGSAQ
jgi:hypothetical protein